MSSEKKSIWWFIVSSLIFSVMSILIKYASYIDSFKTTMFRFAIGMVILGPLSFLGRLKLDFRKPMLLVFRGICGGIAVYLYFWSISEIGLARGTIISHTSTVFSTVFSIIFLKEKMTFIRAFFIGLAVVGLYIMMGGKETGFNINLAKDLLSLTGAAIAGIANVIIKKARETESAYSVFFSQCVIGFWIVLIPANLVPVRMGIGGGLILLSIGITAAAGQLMMTYAYKFTTVTTGSLISMLTPVFNMLIGITLFREVLTAGGFTGMLIVLVSCYMVIMSEDYTKKMLGFFKGRDNSGK